MLAFDIETTGLNWRDPRINITCVCAYDGTIDRLWFPLRGDSLDEFFGLLDSSPALTAFNGVRFDIPFLQYKYNLSQERVGMWRLKLLDFYESSILCFGEGMSLNYILSLNGVRGKTGNGLEAIKLAQDKKWVELGDYCRQDTVKTWALARKKQVKMGSILWDSEKNSFQFQPKPVHG